MNTSQIRSSVVVLLVALILLTGGCISTGNTATGSERSPSTVITDTGGLTPPKLEKMAVSNNRFAIDLYRELSGKDGNLFFSPYSIFVALSMVYEGTGGKTAEEMRSVLHIPRDELERREGMRELILSVDKPASDAYVLRTANALWVQRDYPVKESYISIMRKFYLSQVNEANFKDDPRGAESEINRWVEKQTAGKIRKLVSGLSPLTRLVITNAIYFKANWSRRFDPHNTRNETFHTLNGTVIVPMMHQKGRFRYTEGEGFQALEMPYTGGRLSMLIILPARGRLREIEEKLTPDFINKTLDEMKTENVEVVVPKFRFESTYFLRKTLMEMGMRTAFTDRANFSGISDRPLAISQVIHKTFISVAENGTEAAAATAVIMTAAAAPGQKPEYKVFKADHPFIFLIYDRKTGAILFMGRLMNPKG
ncbi:serpin family protein [Thermococcus sp.]